MNFHEQSQIWARFWELVDKLKKLVSDYEKLLVDKELSKEFPLIEEVYIDSILINLSKIVSNSRNDHFRLEKFKSICRVELKNEIEDVEKQFTGLFGKIVTNRNKLIGHLDKNFYIDLTFSDNEIDRMEKQMVERLQISIEEAKSIFSSMPRANDKSQERYTLGDFREDFPDIKKIVEKLHDVWTRSIPFEAK